MQPDDSGRKEAEFNSAIDYLRDFGELNREAHICMLTNDFRRAFIVIDSIQIEIMPRLLKNNRTQVIIDLEAQKRTCQNLLMLFEQNPQSISSWLMYSTIRRWHATIEIRAHEEGLRMTDKGGGSDAIKIV